MHRTAAHAPRLRRPSGFTLVEVLVALVVLSIGLLGIGKLMLFSARANDSAYMRSQATALAYTILDDMRTNSTEAINGTYNVGLGAFANPGLDCVTGACTTGMVAQYDLYQWKQRLIGALGPTGDGSVVTVTGADPISGANMTTALITVQWNDTVAQQSFGVTAGPAQNVTVTLQTVL
jgi:type IV pilus assembly protein PilV